MRLSLPPACRHGPEQGMRPLGFPFDALERLQLLDIQGVQFCLRAPKHALNTHSYRWAQKLNVWPGWIWGLQNARPDSCVIG